MRKERVGGEGFGDSGEKEERIFRSKMPVLHEEFFIIVNLYCGGEKLRCSLVCARKTLPPAPSGMISNKS